MQIRQDGGTKNGCEMQRASDNKFCVLAVGISQKLAKVIFLDTARE